MFKPSPENICLMRSKCSACSMAIPLRTLFEVALRRYLLSFRSRRTRGVKSSGRAGKKRLIFAGIFEVPGSNLVCAPFHLWRCVRIEKKLTVRGHSN